MKKLILAALLMVGLGLSAMAGPYIEFDQYLIPGTLQPTQTASYMFLGDLPITVGYEAIFTQTGGFTITLDGSVSDGDLWQYLYPEPDPFYLDLFVGLDWGTFSLEGTTNATLLPVYWPGQISMEALEFGVEGGWDVSSISDLYAGVDFTLIGLDWIVAPYFGGAFHW